MATPFIGEVKLFAFNFAPRGWAQCNGQLLQIAQNQALFSLLGTNYGGNGSQTFGLPDLRGRCAISFGPGYALGAKAGVESVPLIATQIPQHGHTISANVAAGNQPNPGGGFPATDNTGNVIYSTSGGVALSNQALANAGSNQPHENRMPSLVVNFCIALQGIFPSQN